MEILGAMRIVEVDLGERSVEKPGRRGIIFPNRPFIRNAAATSRMGVVIMNVYYAIRRKGRRVRSRVSV